MRLAKESWEHTSVAGAARRAQGQPCCQEWNDLGQSVLHPFVDCCCESVLVVLGTAGDKLYGASPSFPANDQKDVH